jgi:hypothetical protein
VQAEISRAKNLLVTPESYEAARRTAAAPLMAAFVARKRDRAEASNARDLDDRCRARKT